MKQKYKVGKMAISQYPTSPLAQIFSCEFCNTFKNTFL